MNVLNEVALLLQLSIAEAGQVNRDLFEMLSSHAVLTVEELDEDFATRAHRAVIFYHDVFESFHESTRDISCISRLDSRINETFTASHSVEVEFRGSQSGQVAVGDEAFRLGAIVVLGEVGQGALVEAKSDSLSFNVLLAATSHNLRDVIIVTLRARLHHIDESVVFVQVIETEVTSCVSGCVQSLVHLMLKGFHCALTGLRLQTPILGHADDLADLALVVSNNFFDLAHDIWLCNNIRHTHSETRVNQPVVHDELDV